MLEVRKLIGLYGYEQVTLPTESNEELVVDGFQFVRGISMDSR